MLAFLEAHHGETRFIARFDPIEELVCCILSQNTSDTLSFPAFTRLLETFPSWAEVAAAGAAGVAECIQHAGLSRQKSKSIVESLRRIRESFGGYTLEPLRATPLDEARTWLCGLPGVGPKTASIVLSFAMGRDAIAVDTHVSRVARRLGMLPEGITDAKAHRVLEPLAGNGNSTRLHVLFIQHGRKVCHARNPACGECVVRDVCAWHLSSGAKA